MEYFNLKLYANDYDVSHLLFNIKEIRRKQFPRKG